ncbi:MAG: DUF427 domain-containing protein [Alphaproteobacteria bacterium]|nr:DUF427 domain-containing protein [Alphaproteobacteria bacterium]
MTTLPRETVQDYPRPPALEPVAHRLSVVVGGTEIAATTRGWRILETHHAPSYYLPPDDVRRDLLSPGRGASWCEWKGQASYWDLTLEGETRRALAWSYPRPTSRYADIAGHFAFYAGKVDAAFVGDLPVLAQPGSFYGGWVTANLDGTIKGGPGTEGW